MIPSNDKYIAKDKLPADIKIYSFSLGGDKADLHYKDNKAIIRINGQAEVLFDTQDLKVSGEHMKLNMLIAAGFCRLAGIKNKNIVDGVRAFKGAPYRLELVREWNGIKFINDTTATIPDAAYNALRSYKDPVIWIAGGNDKNLDFSILKGIRDIPKKIFLLSGNGTDKMKEFIDRDDITESDSLEHLFDEAVKLADKGDIVLLSPGCTSFGLFQNEFHRGDVFNKLVNSL